MSTKKVQNINKIRKKPLNPAKIEQGNTQRQMIDELWDLQEAAIFHHPVDYKNLGLIDYPILIKNPMDMSTIKKKIQKGKYRNNNEFMNDVQLIWDNCKKYNVETSEIYDLAIKMEKNSRKLFRKYLNVRKPGFKKTTEYQQSAVYVTPQQLMSFEEKVRFGQRIKQFTQEQLIELIKIIVEQCPSSLQSIQKESFKISLTDFNSQALMKAEIYLDSLENTNSGL